MLGVNLAGAEFGDGVGGVLGTHYTWPTNAEVDYYVGQGIKIFRIPFLFHRILPTGIATLVSLANYITSKGCYSLLDPHEYGKIDGVPVSNSTARTQFVEYWTDLAAATKSNLNVIYGLINEPKAVTQPDGISAADWLVAANAAIAAIRAEGADHLIVVPGTDWTGAHSWLNNNAAVMGEVVDSVGNFCYEVHQYLDPDSSGTSRTATAGAGSTRLVNFTNWCRALGRRAILGEVGWASPEGNVEGEAILDYMDANRDVWISPIYWAGGPWWYNSTTGVDYMYNIEPVPTLAGTIKPQMTILKSHSAS
jgi:endoglucanase